MVLSAVLEKCVKEVKINSEERRFIENTSRIIINEIEKKLHKNKIDASVFVGGSVAKGTMIKKGNQDIDIFVRFNQKYSEDEIKKQFKKIFFWFKIKGLKTKVKKVHGSRDYYKINFKRNEKINIEIVPSVNVKKPEEARNTTDLSYFHIKYINKKLRENKKLIDEIILAKSFCHSQKVYGAESYINGFSGYALELLICYYGSFEKMLYEMSETKGQIIVDIEKMYKDKYELLEKLNPSKKKCPVILIDPTFKERNVAMALSHETFEKFRTAAKEFLANPNEGFFIEKKIEKTYIKEKAEKFNANFNVIYLRTNKQEGDIAGTKLKKFAKVLFEYINKNIDIIEWHFEYSGGRDAEIYVISKKRQELVSIGPHKDNKKAVEHFKKAHPIWYVGDDGRIRANKNPNQNIKLLIKQFKRSNRKQIKNMSIIKLKTYII
ncbi:MAG TPA: nucleotidyltransferase domain-containing protein [Candidatus Paceibacterota bacterium]|nr:nucleotidyltransferase domain-containing protein [Candidatus Paceibacterota bacterium]